MLGKRETIEKHFPDFRIDLLEIPGTSYTDSQQRYTYRIDEQENLWEYYFECFSRLKQKIDVQFILGSEGFGQELSPGLEGIREALVNMLMHADYFSPAKSRIRIFSDRIEFFNPGGLPKPFAELKNRDMSLPRNPILAKLFRMVRLAENAGFGLDKMDERWRQYNNTVPLYGIEFDSVSLTFNLRPTAADGSAGVIAGELNAKEAHEAAYDTAHDGAHDLSPTESAILTACRGGPQSSQELLIALGYSTRTGNFKKALARLNHDLGLVEPTVPGALRSRHQKYRLSDKGRALLEKS
jgi:predicted HTH transcriptional regulator